MAKKYLAKIFFGNNEFEDKSGDDLDELYAWMLSNAEGKFGNIHGEVIDNQSKKVVKQFRKSPPD